VLAVFRPKALQRQLNANNRPQGAT
jgi:hypothetical protein